MTEAGQWSGAVKEHWAHNPEVDTLKPPPAAASPFHPVWASSSLFLSPQIPSVFWISSCIRSEFLVYVSVQLPIVRIF